jgi:ElaB/YqjD/DUF883 family membrane-anchored ribosome-binding protein
MPCLPSNPDAFTIVSGVASIVGLAASIYTVWLAGRIRSALQGERTRIVHALVRTDVVDRVKTRIRSIYREKGFDEEGRQKLRGLKDAVEQLRAHVGDPARLKADELDQAIERALKTREHDTLRASWKDVQTAGKALMDRLDNERRKLDVSHE